jgi:capsular exopolysaccharide synthesis family protein
MNTPSSSGTTDHRAGSPPARPGKRGKMPENLWSEFGEEFRNLRTRVAALLDKRNKIVLVTSALPQEGKTTVAATLSRSFAQMEWRTLLVDSDMRKPRLHHLFGIERAPGLTDLLQGRVGDEDAVAATDHSHLDVVPSGSPTQGPAELLQAEVTPALLRRLAARYDYVVIDAPPLISITDTHLLSDYVDGIIFVINGLVTPRDVVQEAREQLQGRPVLGVVLNGISTPKKYYYY